MTTLPPPPPAPPTRKRWFTRPRYIVPVAVLLILIIVGSATSKPAKTVKAASATTTTAAATSTTTATTVATPATDPPSPATTAATTPPPPTQPSGKDGNFAFTVNSQQCGLTTIGTSYPETAPAGTQWCVYLMTVTNDKSAAGDFFAGNQKAIDASGKQLSADTTALIYMDNSSASDMSTINPGVSIDVTVPFQLATGDTIKYLDLHDSMFSGGVKVNVG